MEVYAVYIQHSGEWNSENNFVNFVGDRVVMKYSYSNCETDSELNIVEIKFIPKDGLPPILIYNDTGVEADYDAYTIDMLEFDNDEIESENDEGSPDATENDDCVIIDNILRQSVAVDQVYINKKIIVSVMKNYALSKKFQFKVKRSSATSKALAGVLDKVDDTMKLRQQETCNEVHGAWQNIQQYVEEKYACITEHDGKNLSNTVIP
ncbi:hypothetical protein RND71_015953 [Anisodus tanguticus]|uniref:Uncharacterized protein n=1 Tax=Anisodus tanguticus TaxID=243964 RepID=A0AAE1S7A9_9SOLA|nr:hypothetical protein RND71_015953 [Anisodus tanguticus]